MLRTEHMYILIDVWKCTCVLQVPVSPTRWVNKWSKIILFCVLDPPKRKRLKKYQTLVPVTKANDNPVQNGTLRFHLVFQIANMICLVQSKAKEKKKKKKKKI